MTGFTKLFSSIVSSSIWCEDDVTLRVWIALLALSDAHGDVDASIPGLASLCRMPVEDCERAIGILCAPDPHSRSKTKEGRRIELRHGGFRIINYASYRSRGQDKDGSRAAYMRARRSAGSSAPGITEAKSTPERSNDLKWSAELQKFVGDLPEMKEKLKLRYLGEFDLDWLSRVWANMTAWGRDHPKEIEAKRDYGKFILGWYRRSADQERERRDREGRRRAT